MTLLRLHTFRPSSVVDVVAAVTNCVKPGSLERPAAVTSAPSVPSSASPVRAATPVAASTENGDIDWHQIVLALPLSGLARTLAQHCELRRVGESDCLLRLAPAHSHLQMKPALDKLQQVLSDYFRRPLMLRFELASNETDTPAVAAGRERQERQGRAIASIEQDVFVRDVIESFDASLVESSIKPIA